MIRNYLVCRASRSSICKDGDIAGKKPPCPKASRRISYALTPSAHDVIELGMALINQTPEIPSWWLHTKMSRFDALKSLTDCFTLLYCTRVKAAEYKIFEYAF